MKVYVLLKSDFKGNFKLIKLFTTRDGAKNYKAKQPEELQKALIIQEWRVEE